MTYVQRKNVFTILPVSMIVHLSVYFANNFIYGFCTILKYTLGLPILNLMSNKCPGLLYPSHDDIDWGSQK